MVAKAKMHPISIKILDLLDDGEWHDQEDIIDSAQYIIPPGEAYRLAESRAKIPVRDSHELIARGRRHRTVTALNALIQNERVERREKVNNAKELRVLRSRTQVYVILSVEGQLYVHRAGPEDADVHVVDARRKPEDIDAELEHVKTVIDTLPARMDDREEVEAVLKEYYNDLRIDKLFIEASRNRIKHHQ